MNGTDRGNQAGMSEDTVRWIVIPAAGLASAWWSISGALWLSRGLSGGGWVWPHPWTATRATIGGLTGRIDEWMLLNTDAVAFSAPLWFWSIAALLLCCTAALVLVCWQAVALVGVTDDSPQARERKSKQRKLDRDQRAAANATRARSWPIPGPYDPAKRPGPGVLIGQISGRPAVSKANTPVLVVGPTGSGKTRHIIAPNLAHWPGPVVATSVRMDLAELTVGYRADRGKVWGFDPSGRLWPAMRALGIRPTVWDPVRLLRTSLDPAADSILLATFLMSQTSAEGQGGQGIWATLAKQMTMRLLWLSRTFEADLAQVLDWVLDPATLTERIPKHEIANLPRTDQLHLAKLQAMAKKDARIFDSIIVTMEEVIESLRHTADHPEADLLPVGLTTDGTSDTLYMIADHLSQNSHRPLFAAALRHLFHATETHGNSAQRLNLMIQQARHDAETAAKYLDLDVAADPLHDAQPNPNGSEEPARREGLMRALFDLDEITNLAPLPDLPEITSTLRSEAQLITGIQAVSQLTAKWKENADSMLANHPTRVQLGGSADAGAMRQLAELSGDDDVDTASMRMIDPGHARVLLGTQVMFDIKLADTDKWIDPKRVMKIDVAAALPSEVGPDPQDTSKAPGPRPDPPADPTPAPPAEPAAPDAPDNAAPPAQPEAIKWIPATPDRVTVGAAHVGPAGEHAPDDARVAAFAAVRDAGQRRPRRASHPAAASDDPLDLQAARDDAHGRLRGAAQQRRSARHAGAGPPNGMHSPVEVSDDNDYDVAEPIPLRPQRPESSAPPPKPPAEPPAPTTHAATPEAAPSPEPEPDTSASARRHLSDVVRPSRAELLRVGVFVLAEATPQATTPSADHAAKIAEMLTDDDSPVTAADLLAAFAQGLDQGDPR